MNEWDLIVNRLNKYNLNNVVIEIVNKFLVDDEIYVDGLNKCNQISNAGRIEYFLFIDSERFIFKGKKYTNLIVSKSGNTIETITNANILIKKKDKNIFITENKKNYLNILAKKFKSEIIHHNNFIGGRYSVLSEVGMLPAELMGLNSHKFKQLNNLIKNKNYLNSLVNNVDQILYFAKRKKFTPVIVTSLSSRFCSEDKIFQFFFVSFTHWLIFDFGKFLGA